jgi:hypothetical protein
MGAVAFDAATSATLIDRAEDPIATGKAKRPLLFCFQLENEKLVPGVEPVTRTAHPKRQHRTARHAVLKNLPEQRVGIGTTQLKIDTSSSSLETRFRS